MADLAAIIQTFFSRVLKILCHHAISADAGRRDYQRNLALVDAFMPMSRWNIFFLRNRPVGEHAPERRFTADRTKTDVEQAKQKNCVNTLAVPHERPCGSRLDFRHPRLPTSDTGAVQHQRFMLENVINCALPLSEPLYREALNKIGEAVSAMELN